MRFMMLPLGVVALLTFAGEVLVSRTVANDLTTCTASMPASIDEGIAACTRQSMRAT
jgi:hypothetical protein